MIVINPYVVSDVLVGTLNGELQHLGYFCYASEMFVGTITEHYAYEFTDKEHEDYFWESVDNFTEENDIEEE